MFIKTNGRLVEESTGNVVFLERFLGLYTTRYYYILTGHGKVQFFEEINKTYRRADEEICLKDLSEDKQRVLMEVIESFDADAERRRAFWQ